MRYHNATLKRKETEVEESTVGVHLFVSLRNQSAMRQTSIDFLFGTVSNNSEEEDGEDDDEGGTIENEECTDKE